MIMNERHYSFIVCGTVRNVGKTLKNDVNRLIEAIGEYKRLDWYLVESDSDDDTLDKLCELKNNLEGFNYSSFGELRAEYPERIDRLIYCRNKYYDYVNSLEWSNYDYVIVMDFDGINNKLNKLAFWSSWERSDWDVVTANQDGPYYDIWALKHKYWNPSDCFQTNDFFSGFVDEYVSFLINVKFKQFRIPINHEWIEVDSAYGGIAIYKSNVFIDGQSYSSNSDLGEVCDSIPFHKNIVDKGYKVFINPRFINADYTEHTLWRKPGLSHSIQNVIILFLVLIGPKFRKFLRKFKRLFFK